jgi:metallo-beta-lactamase family protein
MSIEVEFLGAARTVTGSMHLVHTSKARILLDCGLYQGRRAESFRRNRDLAAGADDVDVVVLSHAHIDHSGALPRLFRDGFRGPVYTTPATRDLSAVMLADAAMIQEQDARYIQKKIERDHSDMEPVEPLYDQEDVAKALAHFRSVPYRERVTIAEGVDLVFYDAGHVLGSAVVALDIDDEGDRRRLVFSGDLGRSHMPILRDPEVPPNASFLIMESTYGDRLHGPIERMDEDLAFWIDRTVARGGKVVIPTFALERAQEVVYALKRLRKAGRLPRIPVYVDSPLTVKITDVFRLHPDEYDAEARALLYGGDSPFDFPELTYVESVEESKAINADKRPSIVLAASGMCEFGRVVHHLRSTIGGAENTVLIIGFQAEHTLGRRLVEQRRKVKIFGVMQERLCEVAVLDGFSAHADRDGLLSFAETLRERGPLRGIALVHGEPTAQDALRDELLARGFPTVHVPERGERIRF